MQYIMISHNAVHNCTIHLLLVCMPGHRIETCSYLTIRYIITVSTDLELYLIIIQVNGMAISTVIT